MATTGAEAQPDLAAILRTAHDSLAASLEADVNGAFVRTGSIGTGPDAHQKLSPAEREARLSSVVNVLGFSTLDDLENFVFLHGGGKVVPAAQRDTLPLDETQTQFSETRRAKRNEERRAENAILKRDLATVRAELQWARSEAANAREEKEGLVKDKQRLLNTLESLRSATGGDTAALTRPASSPSQAGMSPTDEVRACWDEIESLEAVIARLEEELATARTLCDEQAVELRDLREEVVNLQQDKTRAEALEAELQRVREKISSLVPAILGAAPLPATPGFSAATPSGATARSVCLEDAVEYRTDTIDLQTSTAVQLSSRPPIEHSCGPVALCPPIQCHRCFLRDDTSAHGRKRDALGRDRPRRIESRRADLAFSPASDARSSATEGSRRRSFHHTAPSYSSFACASLRHLVGSVLRRLCFADCRSPVSPADHGPTVPFPPFFVHEQSRASPRPARAQDGARRRARQLTFLRHRPPALRGRSCPLRRHQPVPRTSVPAARPGGAQKDGDGWHARACLRGVEREGAGDQEGRTQLAGLGRYARCVHRCPRPPAGGGEGERGRGGCEGKEAGGAFRGGNTSCDWAGLPAGQEAAEGYGRRDAVHIGYSRIVDGRNTRPFRQSRVNTPVSSQVAPQVASQVSSHVASQESARGRDDFHVRHARRRVSFDVHQKASLEPRLA